MHPIIPLRPLRAATTAAALLLLCACQNVPKYKHSSGRFDEWSDYEGRNFQPASATVLAVDPAANTVTVIQHEKNVVLNVLPTTRIMHDGTDITLAQLPLNKPIKYTMSEDGTQLRTIWYGENSESIHRAASKSKSGF
jgi:hypothetical protein